MRGSNALINARVTAVGDDGERVLERACGVVHLAGGTDHRGHGGIDDHIARNMKVGYAFVGVDHRDGRTVRVGGSDIGFDRGFFVGG